ASNISGASSGSGTTIAQTLTTPSVASVGTVTYSIVPQAEGCLGTPYAVVVNVQPVPSASVGDLTICSGQNAILHIPPAPQLVPGTTFSWIAVPSGNVDGAADGNGAVINQSLSTTDALVGTVVYQITPSVNGCNGPVHLVTVTVNPIPTADADDDFSVCEPVTIPLTGTIGGAATSGTWTVVSPFDGSISSSVMSGSDVNATYTVGSADIGQVLIFRLTTNDPDNGGPCSFVFDEVHVTINEQARVTLPADYTVCEPNVIALTGTLSGSATTGLWSLITGNGTLSSTSLTTPDVMASYQPALSDVTTTLQFRLTTNDPDGSGPCVAEYADINIHVNESAKVNAGVDFAVCEDAIVSLNGSFDGSATSVTWDKGLGTGTF